MNGCARQSDALRGQHGGNGTYLTTTIEAIQVPDLGPPVSHYYLNKGWVFLLCMTTPEMYRYFHAFHTFVLLSGRQRPELLAAKMPLAPVPKLT